MKNILKKFSFFAMLVAIISAALSGTSIAEEHVHEAVTRGDTECWYEIVDDIYHKERLGYDQICSCGVVIKKKILAEATHKHVYKGDICKYCQYTKVHTHQGVSKGNKVTTLIEYDENTHTYSIAYENLCSCGEVVCLIDETINMASHTFKNDKCTECGYQKKHTHEGSTLGKKIEWYENANEDGHTFVTTNESLCICGEVVGLIDRVEKHESHIFSGDKCLKCGYITKNPQLDNDTQSILGDFFEDVALDGAIAQIVEGEIPNAGFVIDVSGLLANKNIVADNSLELVPLIGLLKYKDDVYAVVKNADDLENIIENADKFYKITPPIIMHGDETAKVADVACGADNFAIVDAGVSLCNSSDVSKKELRICPLLKHKVEYVEKFV